MNGNKYFNKTLYLHLILPLLHKVPKQVLIFFYFGVQENNFLSLCTYLKCLTQFTNTTWGSITSCHLLSLYCSHCNTAIKARSDTGLLERPTTLLQTSKHLVNSLLQQKDNSVSGQTHSSAAKAKRFIHRPPPRS